MSSAAAHLLLWCTRVDAKKRRVWFVKLFRLVLRHVSCNTQLMRDARYYGAVVVEEEGSMCAVVLATKLAEVCARNGPVTSAPLRRPLPESEVELGNQAFVALRELH